MTRTSARTPVRRMRRSAARLTLTLPEPLPCPSVGPHVVCERPKCSKPVTDDWLYCSRECFDLDNDPVPVRPRIRHKGMKDTRFGERQ